MTVVGCNVLYKALNIFDKNKPKYDHYLCCYTGDFNIVDCFPCTKYGDIHPEYNNAGTPINVNNLGDAIGRLNHNGEIDLFYE